METLRFYHSESDRDTEADVLRDDRAISLGEEIYEEARWWIKHSVLFILVDDAGPVSVMDYFCFKNK